MLRGDIRTAFVSALHQNGGSLRTQQRRCVSPSSRLYCVYHKISDNITTFYPFVNGIFTKKVIFSDNSRNRQQANDAHAGIHHAHNAEQNGDDRVQGAAFLGMPEAADIKQHQAGHTQQQCGKIV